MTDLVTLLQPLLVPVLLVVSILALVVADVLLPGPQEPPHDPTTGLPRPPGRKGPVSFRDLRRDAPRPAPVGLQLGLVPQPAGGVPLTLLRQVEQGPPPPLATTAAAPQPTAKSIENPKDLLGIVTAVQLGLILLVRLWQGPTGLQATAAFRDDGLTAFSQSIVLGTALLAVLGLTAHARKHFARRQGELYGLLLSTVLGLTLLAGARDLLLAVVAFELAGLPLYVLTGYAKTGAGLQPLTQPAEASLKLYLTGALSAGITLYGLSLLYGVAGGTHVDALRAAGDGPLVRLGVVLVFVGFGFKLGLAPFHFWMPDTYQGAPAPIVAFLSVAPKVAALLALVRLFGSGVADPWRWMLPAVVLAVTSLVVGNVLAVIQRNTKRLLANSGVVQMGTMALGLLAVGMSRQGEGLATLLFYGVAYLFANVGLFLVLEALADDAGPQPADTLDALAGLHHRSPGLAVAALVCLLSLAGVPFALGFWAKLFLFVAVWQAGYAWLVLLAVLLATLALFYYLRMARAMYLGTPAVATPLRAAPGLRWAIGLCALATMAVGLYPGPLLDLARAAAATAW